MATLTVTKPNKTGTAWVPVSASANGDQFANTGKEFLYVKNGGAGAITVTFDCPNACSFGVTNAAHDLVISVNNSVESMIGPFETGRFNDANAMVQVTYSNTSSVTVAAVSKD